MMKLDLREKVNESGKTKGTGKKTAQEDEKNHSMQTAGKSQHHTEKTQSWPPQASKAKEQQSHLHACLQTYIYKYASSECMSVHTYAYTFLAKICSSSSLKTKKENLFKKKFSPPSMLL